MKRGLAALAAAGQGCAKKGEKRNGLSTQKSRPRLSPHSWKTHSARALLSSRAKEILIIYKNTQCKSLMSVGAARLLSPVTLLSRAPERARSQKVFNSVLILRAVVSAAKTRRRRQLSYIPAAKVPDAGRVSFCEDAPVVAFSKVSQPGTWKAEMSGGGKSSSPICICARESFFSGEKEPFYAEPQLFTASVEEVSLRNLLLVSQGPFLCEN